MVVTIIILALLGCIVIPLMYRVTFIELVLCLLVIIACLAWLDGII